MADDSLDFTQAALDEAQDVQQQALQARAAADAVAAAVSTVTSNTVNSTSKAALDEAATQETPKSTTTSTTTKITATSNTTNSSKKEDKKKPTTPQDSTTTSKKSNGFFSRKPPSTSVKQDNNNNSNKDFTTTPMETNAIVQQIPLAPHKKNKSSSPRKPPSSITTTTTTTTNHHHTAKDPAFTLVVYNEEAPTNPATQVLTAAALDRIAHHQYVAGTYTWLDNILNPIWTQLTELLPMTLHPNLVTLLGGLHCLPSYIWTWQAQPTAIEAVPPYLLVANGYCLTVAYTLDCMDGKQARRTKTSSPLGQLLDHGLDCLCLLAHVAACQAWLRAGDTLQLQMVLQLSFYIAQWEEFYTGILPHATGPIGVTEVNYSLAMISLVHGITGVASGETSLYEGRIVDDLQVALKKGWVSYRLLDVVAGYFYNDTATTTTMDQLSTLLEGIQRKDVLLFLWCLTMSTLCCLSLGRVMLKLDTMKHRATALLQLTTPLLIVGLALINEFGGHYDGNELAIRTTIRWKSLAIGLLFCHVTIKVIVYSMARQAVAMIQWEALPLIGAIILSVCDPRLHYDGHVLLWQSLALVWGVVLWRWSTAAMAQICDRLKISAWIVQEKKE